MDRDQVILDLEAFAALAPTLGLNARRDTPLDLAVALDPDFSARLAAWLQIQRKDRRARIRRAARARKNRRGWR